MDKYMDQVRNLKKLSDKFITNDTELGCALYSAAISIQELVALLETTRSALLDKIKECDK